MKTAVCPRCERECDRREGSYYVCVDCRWRWTVSLTGKVYVQAAWQQLSAPDADTRDYMAHRLLDSIDGLSQKLASLWPAASLADDRAVLGQAGFTPHELERLRKARDATLAGYFNEGVPLASLRSQAHSMPHADEGDQPTV
jgi:hypothetical protein